ncbi:sigma-70 family RNA polymerase sigma factor [Virgibacillus sp. MSP4-1]|uniref:RNA polymerase sigma factor n=1 Tax=Virgibacillus sp. MSP4-1 TaxID=2700081 RepID=UPI00039ECE76|nr:sigma-70 family RNA polymerase sigma factor [Virgibacillus sp. MSP4-1]QHS21607.1 sigma-70 family RNA polymerase sigma factor [Virgibacillus sp. MSP4-1]
MLEKEKTDEELLKAVEKGSLDDFKVLYERYFQFIYKIVYSILKDREDTSDLCHDLFLEYYRKANSYHPSRGSVKSWLAVRAKSRAIDYIRKKDRVILKEQLLYQKESTDQSVEDIALANDDKKQLKEALQHLPPAQRQAIYLNYIESLSHKETAERLDRPLGTVKSLIRYGIRNLKKYYLSPQDLQRGDRHDA